MITATREQKHNVAKCQPTRNIEIIHNSCENDTEYSPLRINLTNY